jgi:hypothetical protein
MALLGPVEAHGGCGASISSQQCPPGSSGARSVPQASGAVLIGTNRERGVMEIYAQARVAGGILIHDAARFAGFALSLLLFSRHSSLVTRLSHHSSLVTRHCFSRQSLKIHVASQRAARGHHLEGSGTNIALPNSPQDVLRLSVNRPSLADQRP